MKWRGGAGALWQRQDVSTVGKREERAGKGVCVYVCVCVCEGGGVGGGKQSATVLSFYFSTDDG